MYIMYIYIYNVYIQIYIFFYLGFLPRTFTNHRTAGEWGGQLLTTTSTRFTDTLHISRAITAESSSLHIASSRTPAGNLWFPSASCFLLSYAPFIWKWVHPFHRK